jgi:uncharacterized protein involved in exopolysaccharide biosynthesis
MRVLNRASRSDRADDAVDAMLGDDLDFGRYVIAIWRRGWLVLLVALLSGAAVAAASWLRPPIYRASSTLAVSGSKIGEQAVPSVAAVNFRPLIENNSVAATVIEEFQLGAPPHSMTPESFLTGHLAVEEVRNSSLITLHVDLPDPAQAAAVANRISDLAVDGARRLSQNEAVQARDDIQVEVEQARKQMDEAAMRLQTFRNTAQIELTREDVNAMLFERGRLPDLIVEIEAERARLARAEADLASRQRVDSFTRTIDTDAALSEAARVEGGSRSSVLGLQLKSEEVNRVYETLEQDVLSTQAQLAALEKRRAQLVDVRRLGARQQAKLTELYQKEAELTRLQTEHQVAEKSYTEIAARYDVARLQVAGRSAQLQVIDRAIVPSQPRRRHLVRNSLFAILAGATLMAVGIVLTQALGDVLSRTPRS